MANGNPYAPLYSSVAARGRLSPLGAPGALKPEVKKKGLGDKMAGALGAMIDQSMEADRVSKKERVAQLRLRNKEIEKQHKKLKIPTPTTGISPIIEKVFKDEDNTVQRDWVQNPDYVPERNRNYPESYPDTLLEMEWFDNQREIDSYEGKRSSGFLNPEVNNQVLYPNYTSKYFDELPSAKSDQGALGRFLSFLN